MHHFESGGYQFNYNGDYSGKIHLFSPSGFESHLTFDQLTQITQNPVTEYTNGIRAVRDFVAEAVRSTRIRMLENMDTDELLGDDDAKTLFELVKRNQ